MTPLGYRRSAARIPAASCAVLVAVLLAASGCGSGSAILTAQPTTPQKGRVEKGTVVSGASGTGALTAVSSQILRFQTTGTIRSVEVKVGDPVTPGQVLATLDDFVLRQTLGQQQAALREQMGLLDQLTGGTAVQVAKDNVDAYRKYLDATRKNGQQAVDVAEDTVERARVRLGFDRRQLDEARAEYQECTTLDPLVDCSAEKQAVVDAKSVVIDSETALEDADGVLDAARTQLKVDVESIRVDLVDAEGVFKQARSDQPGAVASQRALVAGAAAAVALAQRDVDNTVLRAPVAGTVEYVNGGVGEIADDVAAPLTPQAPGSPASVPDVGAPAADSTALRQPGFMKLSGVGSYQVVVPFEEAEAAKVAPNQQVEITVAAIPDLSLPGTVLALAPTATDISEVTSFYVTILLAESDDRLRDGHTVDVVIPTETVEDVLTVPTAAVVHDGDVTAVDVVGPDGEPVRTPFEAGLEGRDSTQVLSGLQEGQEVLIVEVPEGEQE